VIPACFWRESNPRHSRVLLAGIQPPSFLHASWQESNPRHSRVLLAGIQTEENGR
ncbi:MAG: hypothetical protein ACI909_002356, partial [Planctomycetota bacterium]